VPPELERFAGERIRDFEIPDLLPDLDEVDVFERSEERDDGGADDEAERYFFL
jgi:hypothetical protein